MPFLDNLVCELCTMFTLILKKIIKFKSIYDFDGRFWIQKALLNKNFKDSSF